MSGRIVQSDSLGCSWPEQDAVNAWKAKHDISLAWPVQRELQRVVTDIRLTEVERVARAERLACATAICPGCAMGQAPRRLENVALAQGGSGWFHDSEVIPGALVRCPASGIFELPRQKETP